MENHTTYPLRRLATLAQLPLTLSVLAWVPNNFIKLLALLVIWKITFGRLATREWLAYAAICGLFTVMNLGALHQGVFSFTNPDLLGLPAWEFFMWGFYLLHVIRMLDGPPPREQSILAGTLAVGFALPFLTIADSTWLTAITGSVVLLALAFLHEPLDIAYTAYSILLGAAVEYTGVWSGLWSYPGDGFGGVPPWFVPMWGGIGLFTRRLLVPLLHPPQMPTVAGPTNLKHGT